MLDRVAIKIVNGNCLSLVCFLNGLLLIIATFRNFVFVIFFTYYFPVFSLRRDMYVYTLYIVHPKRI